VFPPAATGKNVQKPCTPASESSLLEFSGRVMPIDLAHDHQIGRIDVQALRAAQVRQVATIEVLLQPVPRDLGDALDAVERPAPALVRVDAEVIQAAMNRFRGPAKVAGELSTRKQADAFPQVPVFQVAPGLLKASSVDPRGRPRLAERLEVGAGLHRARGRGDGYRNHLRGGRACR